MTGDSKKKISPSILSADILNLEKEVRKIEEAGVEYIHIDIMDGHFVPNITFGPGLVESLKKATKIPLDVHLMIENPERFIEQFAKAGSDVITVHYESMRDRVGLLKEIRKLGKRSGISINPDTPADVLNERGLLENLDWILVMTVYPGFSSQKFIPGMLDKIRRVREIINENGFGSAIELAVDGGVKIDNIREIAQAGATVLASGSGIFKTQDYKKTIAEMRRLITESEEQGA